MIVAPKFPGDDMVLARLQHEVYGDALRVVVDRCNRFGRLALAILEQDAEHPGWKGVDRFDHRTLQFSHDLLAAAWRYEESPPQLSLLLSESRPKDAFQADTSEERWLQWLDSEVASWLHPEAGPGDDGPQKIRLVLRILANQNQPSGYEAESYLAQLIYRRFSHVPWDNVLYPD